MSKLRVLHIHSGMVGGGIETLIQAWARELAPEFESALFTVFWGRFYSGENIPRTEEPGAALAPWRRVAKLAGCLREWRPDIIHMHYGDALVYGTLGRRAAGSRARTVAHWHTTTNGRPSRTPWGHALQSWCLRQADVVLGCSRNVVDAGQAVYKLPSTRVRVLYNPVEGDRFDQAEPMRDLRARLGMLPQETLVVFLGRLDVHTKGLDTLAQAISLLPEGLRYRVLLVGPGDLEVVESQVGVPGRTIFYGPCERERVPSLLKACDLCVQPSRREGLGLSIVEAMAAGLPVVATHVGGIPEVVQDGVSGLLVPPESPEELAGALRRLIEHPEERSRMGEAGRRIAADRFSMATICGQLADIYRELCGRVGDQHEGQHAGAH